MKALTIRPFLVRILDPNRDFIAKISPLACKCLEPILKLGRPSVLKPIAVIIHKVTNAFVNRIMLICEGI